MVLCLVFLSAPTFSHCDGVELNLCDQEGPNRVFSAKIQERLPRLDPLARASTICLILSYAASQELGFTYTLAQHEGVSLSLEHLIFVLGQRPCSATHAVGCGLADLYQVIYTLLMCLQC